MLGWDNVDQDQQKKLAAPLERGTTRDQERVPIPQLRSELDACETRLQDAIAELHRIVDGDRVATVKLGGYFSGGIETEEQLDAALAGIREECSRLILHRRPPSTTPTVTTRRSAPLAPGDRSGNDQAVSRGQK